MGKVLNEDFHQIALTDFPYEKLKNTSFLITGATGYLGSLLVKSLLYCNSFYNLNLRIIAQIRNEDKVLEIFEDYLSETALSFLKIDFCNEKLVLEEKVDYIIHTVAVTSSKIMISNPVETILSALKSTEEVMRYSVLYQPKSVVYISSMEIYGSIQNSEKVNENMIGYIDPLAVRSNYPESKRMCENLCISYCREYGVKVKIARLAQTFGAGILPGENRVFAQFAKCAINKENIVLHTTGESEGNYCYTSDAIRAIIVILLRGQDANAYNVANEEMHTSIKNMAQLVAQKIADNMIKVVYDIPETNVYGYAPSVRMKLDTSKLRALGWNPTIGLEEAYRRMIAEMETKN